MAKTRLDFRIEDRELELLEEYCFLTGRTKTDVVRELIRGLRKKLEKLRDKRVD